MRRESTGDLCPSLFRVVAPDESQARSAALLTSRRSDQLETAKGAIERMAAAYPFVTRPEPLIS
jgi:hypothetical protein